MFKKKRKLMALEEIIFGEINQKQKDRCYSFFPGDGYQKQGDQPIIITRTSEVNLKTR